MASIAQLVSEFAHTLGEPNNKPLRQHIKLIVAQTRNEVIRRSYENHGYVDRVLTQRFKVSLQDINDGDLPSIVSRHEDVIVSPKSSLSVTGNNVQIHYDISEYTDKGYLNDANLKIKDDLQSIAEINGISSLSPFHLIYGSFGTYPRATKTGTLDFISNVISPGTNKIADTADSFICIAIPPVNKKCNISLEAIGINYGISAGYRLLTETGSITLESTTEENEGRYYIRTNLSIESSNKYTYILLEGQNATINDIFVNVVAESENIIFSVPNYTIDVVEECPLDVTTIKRTVQQVPRPVRLTNNLPFDRVSSVGFRTSREFPFIKETSARFRSAVPGLCSVPCYDYINGYIYLFPADNKPITINKIVIESAFEHPTAIEMDNGLVDPMSILDESNEWLLSEDMIGQIKEIILKRGLLNGNHRTNEIPNEVKFNQ